VDESTTMSLSLVSRYDNLSPGYFVPNDMVIVRVNGLPSDGSMMHVMRS